MYVLFPFQFFFFLRSSTPLCGCLSSSLGGDLSSSLGDVLFPLSTMISSLNIMLFYSLGIIISSSPKAKISSCLQTKIICIVIILVILTIISVILVLFRLCFMLLLFLFYGFYCYYSSSML